MNEKRVRMAEMYYGKLASIRQSTQRGEIMKDGYATLVGKVRKLYDDSWKSLKKRFTLVWSGVDGRIAVLEKRMEAKSVELSDFHGLAEKAAVLRHKGAEMRHEIENLREEIKCLSSP